MVQLKEIELIAKKIGMAIKAKKVILFGSYAKGTATEESDVDFLIIANSVLPRYKRSRELYKLFNPYPFPMDLLVYTPEEINKSLTYSVSFISNLLKEGKLIYEG